MALGSIRAGFSYCKHPLLLGIGHFISLEVPVVAAAAVAGF